MKAGGCWVSLLCFCMVREEVDTAVGLLGHGRRLELQENFHSY
jgi:hypothetical protein